MKDQKDTSTTDIFSGKSRPGRPRTHIDDAQKQRAYRLRLKLKKLHNQPK